jgi:hypothetical protein
MKHIKPRNLFILNENLDDLNKDRTLYHVSYTQIKDIINKPMWGTLTFEEGLEYYEYLADDNDGQAYLYEIKVNGKFPHIYDVKEVFDENNIDLDDYIEFLGSSPTEHEILKETGTILLLNAGYSGVIHPDTSPTGEVLDTMLVFNPKESVTSFNIIKDGDESTEVKSTPNKGYFLPTEASQIKNKHEFVEMEDAADSFDLDDNYELIRAAQADEGILLLLKNNEYAGSLKKYEIGISTDDGELRYSELTFEEATAFFEDMLSIN